MRYEGVPSALLDDSFCLQGAANSAHRSLPDSLASSYEGASLHGSFAGSCDGSPRRLQPHASGLFTARHVSDKSLPPPFQPMTAPPATQTADLSALAARADAARQATCAQAPNYVSTVPLPSRLPCDSVPESATPPLPPSFGPATCGLPIVEDELFAAFSEAELGFMFETGHFEGHS